MDHSSPAPDSANPPEAPASRLDYSGACRMLRIGKDEAETRGATLLPPGSAGETGAHRNCGRKGNSESEGSADGAWLAYMLRAYGGAINTAAALAPSCLAAAIGARRPPAGGIRLAFCSCGGSTRLQKRIENSPAPTRIIPEPAAPAKTSIHRKGDTVCARS